MKRRTKYPPAISGDWFCVRRPRLRQYRLACCDCLLVHRAEFRVRGGRIYMRVWRDHRKTAALRREERKRRAREVGQPRHVATRKHARAARKGNAS